MDFGGPEGILGNLKLKSGIAAVFITYGSFQDAPMVDRLGRLCEHEKAARLTAPLLSL